MARLKVEGFESLVRDTRSNGIINNNQTEYSLYMARVRAREKQGDEIRNTVKEINNLKAELREIKELIKGVISK
jgi:flagellar hook-associated protein FlgK